LASLIDEFDPALVVMAGFMRVLTGAFIDRYGGRLINIHPPCCRVSRTGTIEPPLRRRARARCDGSFCRPRS